jgi:hypothetical protein
MGTKPWFAPRRFGWGLDPVSAEGWAMVVAAVALSAVARRHGRAGPTRLEPLLGLAVVLIAVLKGTSPGGPRARRAYEAARSA